MNTITLDNGQVVANFTPHAINIIDPNCIIEKPEIRKLTASEDFCNIITTIPPSGQMLNVKFEQNKEFDDVLTLNASIEYRADHPGCESYMIPIHHKHRRHIDPIPDGIDVAIVSGLYASASNDKRCYTVIDPVFTPDGKKILGCRAIGQVQFN